MNNIINKDISLFKILNERECLYQYSSEKIKLNKEDFHKEINKNLNE